MAKRYPSTEYDHKTGTWSVRWREKTADGRTIRKRERGFKSAADAYRHKLDQERKTPLTVTTLAERFLRVHNASESRLRDLRWALDKLTARFPDDQPDELTSEELQAFANNIPEGHRFEVVRAVKQMYRWSREADLLRRDPASKIKNSQRVREEIKPFESWAEVNILAAELGEWGPAVTFACATGLRPQEWISLERRDIDKSGPTPIVLVRRRLTKDKKIKPVTKNGKPRRVPLSEIALAALDALPPRIDSPLIFPARRGSYLDLHNWRSRNWYPALDAAGLARRGPNSCRHTFASFAIRQGIDAFLLSRLMGTSLAMIDQHYGHLLRGADEAALAYLTPKSGPILAPAKATE
jgi:integrase